MSFSIETYNKIKDDAANGFAEAQFLLGELYYYSDSNLNIECDVTKAFAWYSKAAEQHHSRAELMVAYCYENGIGIDFDINKAVFWYTRSAEDGDSAAMTNLANIYYSGRAGEKNLSLALKYYVMGAEAGDVYAQYNLGDAYQSGEYGFIDMSKAVYWYEKSSAQGYVQATYRYAALLYSGEGVEPDYNKAFSLFEQILRMEEGVPRDIYILTEYMIAKCYYVGRGVDVDYALARNIFMRHTSDEIADPESAYYVAEMYRLGQGVVADDYMALSYYIKAVGFYLDEKYDGTCIIEVLNLACFYAGVYYANGRGCSANMMEAIKYWTIAAENDDADSQYNLALAYKNGDGVPQNLDKAIHWCYKAAMLGSEKAKAKLKELV